MQEEMIDREVWVVLADWMKCNSGTREIEQFFHDKIPLTEAMGVRVESRDRERLVLTCPLGLNHNHLGTAFGGSLGALATLAGYGLLWLEMEDPECHIVIRDSKMSYERPVRGELRAVGIRPDEEAMERFKKIYQSKGRSRILIQVEIVEDGRVCAAFEGLFVATRA